MPDDSINAHLDCVSERAANSVEITDHLMQEKGTAREVVFRRVKEPPKRLESPRRAHTFWNVEGFCEYLGKYATPDLVVLGDPEKGVIAATLDEKAARGFERVTFHPYLHPLWKPWQDLLDRRWPDADEVNRKGHMFIRAFGKFLLGQRDLIMEPEARELILTFAQIRHTRNVTMQMGYGVDSVNGVIVETKVEGGKSREVPLHIPETIVLDVPMFVGRPNMEISIDVVVDSAQEMLVVELISGDAKAKRIAAFKDLLADVATALPDAVVTLGSPGTKKWAYEHGGLNERDDD